MQRSADFLAYGDGVDAPEMEPGLRVTGHWVRDLGPGRVGSRVKALTRLFDPDSCSMLWKIVGKVVVEEFLQAAVTL